MTVNSLILEYRNSSVSGHGLGYKKLAEPRARLLDDISLISEESTVCTARAVTQGSHTHGRAARLQTILHHPRASSPHAPQTSLPATASRMVYLRSHPTPTLHPRTRTARQIIMNPRLGQSPSKFMCGGPWHRHDLTGRLSNQQPPFSHAFGHAF